MDVIRPPTAEDVGAMISVKDAATATWNPPPGAPDPEERARVQRELYLHLIETGDSLVGVRGDEVIAFGSSIVRDGVWFLSQLFVRPDVQSGGLGGRILDELLGGEGARASRVRCVLSSDDPRAFGLYLSRGMLPSWSMIQLTRRGARRLWPPARELAPLTGDDLDALDHLDREVRGFTRRVDHAFLASIARGYALRDGSRLRAYAYAHEGGRIGPLAAVDEGALVGVVDAVDALAGPDAAWSAPSAAPVLLRRLLDLGYRPDWQSTFCVDGALGPFDRTSLAGGALL